MAGFDRKIHLLIVDQHKAVRKALHFRLRAMPNIEVVAAVDVDEAQQIIVSSGQIDVALLGLSGRIDELQRMLNLIRELVGRGTAVLALTPFIDEAVQQSIFQAGASRYRLKNIDTPELVADIKGLVSERDKISTKGK